MKQTTPSSSTEPSTTDPESRETRISRDPEGDPLGLAIFINTEELRALGIDPEATTHVRYAVDEDGLHAAPAPAEDSGE